MRRKHSIIRQTAKRLPYISPGFSVYTLILFTALFFTPAIDWRFTHGAVFAGFGLLALWRYSWGFTHFVRSLIYRFIVFPHWRKKCDETGTVLMPEKIYLLLTSYRINDQTTLKTVHAAVQEAIACGAQVSIIASLVELADEFLYRQIFESYNPPEHVKLHIIRIPGKGKREALAQGFRAISRDMPPPDALVALIDGDTMLAPGCLKQCAPFFKMMPKLGGLTTDEFSDISGNNTMRLWQNLRFAQRHILMGSLSLSRRVMTLTGRMSLYRADIICHPDFIQTMLGDHLDHWRLGKVNFLTGDDKTSLYWLLKNGYEQLYVPDVKVWTIEDVPGNNFFDAGIKLMFRWYGNMLRTNARVLALGPRKVPLFVWWCFLDQKLSMWTTLIGPVLAILLSIKYTPVFLLYYLIWVGFVRWSATLSLLAARREIYGIYPFLIYYNQIVGSLIKTFVLFRLDRQSWTRQKTSLARGDISQKHEKWLHWSSATMHMAIILSFISAIGVWAGIFTL